MKLRKVLLILSFVAVSGTSTGFAQEMSKEDWQKEINQATARIDELKARLVKLDAEITNIGNQSSKLDADLLACEDELFKLLGMTRDEINAFEKELSSYESRTEELVRMADADLLRYRDEINSMSKRVDVMSKNKAAKLQRFASRLSALRKRIDGLIRTLSMGAGTYTVGTWKRDRDCLWNIAKKPNIYANAWLWPKIWQGNKDKIRDPDLIKPGWKLNIPPGKELSQQEKSAAGSYYKKKAKG